MTDKIPEPWMFGVDVTVDGASVPGRIVKFTPAGRLRMAWRSLRGRPPFLVSIDEDDRSGGLA